MAAFSHLPVPVIHLILSDLELQDAFRCSRICRQFHRAAKLYFYDEYIKYNWTLPSSSSVIIEFCIMRSRELYSVTMQNLQIEESSSLFRVQNVKFVGIGRKFEAFATHKHELLVVKSLEIRHKLHFQSAIMGLSAGIGTICVLLKDGSVHVVKIAANEEQLEVISPKFEGNIGIICVSMTDLLFSTIDGGLYCWNGVEIAHFSFNPKPKIPIIKAIESKGRQILILFEGGSLYIAEKDTLAVTQPPFFKKKWIAMVAAGLTHSLALQREDTLPLSLWTTEEVAEWMERNRLGDLGRRVLLQGITGREIANFSDAESEEILGIAGKDQLNRFNSIRELAKAGTINPSFTLYGWGKNHNGQLGKLSPDHFSSPGKIECPRLVSGEDIVTLLCLNCVSAFYTSKGRIFAIGGIAAKNRPLDCTPPAWVDMTAALGAAHPKLSIETVFAGVNEVYYLVVRTLVEKKTAGKRGKKGALDVMKQMMWDPDMRPEELIIAYKDEEVGIKELPAAEFQRRSIPNSAIVCFKRYGEVLWQRC